MNSLIVKPVESADEFAKAYELALSVFTENSSIQQYKDHKLFAWTKDPYFDYRNILLAKYQEQSVGLIRIVPRVLYRCDQSFSVAGISSVCLLPSFRGMGLSVPLMDQSLVTCRERGYDIAFLFARRAADHYYTRFGFYGVASYSKVFVKRNSNLTADPALALAEMDTALINVYASAYERSYQNCFGKMQRTNTYWQFLLGSVSGRNDCYFHTIQKEGIAVGYLVGNANKILEIALITDIHGDGLVSFLTTQLSLESNNDQLELDILPQHILVASLKGMDITFQSRECNYGGHMLKIINTKKMTETEELAPLKNKSLFSYEETCFLMGIFSPALGTGSQGKALPFDISYIDQF